VWVAEVLSGFPQCCPRDENVGEQQLHASAGPLRCIADEDLAAADDDVERKTFVVETALDDATGERTGHAKDGSETRIVVRVIATS
jgi:hypothetical protein